MSDEERRDLQVSHDPTDDGPRTLAQIALELGISRERVRQIEETALRKLRDPALSKGLEDFLE